MNILLVDDQPNIISSLVSCIPWHSLGISSIYTATSAASAREILLSHSVDILITDIEMPHEDGLSLISWIRENDFKPECILLTSHADFFYAKRAINLRVADYIIQPARDEDIIKAVKNAVARLKEQTEKESLLRYSNFDFSEKNITTKALFDSWPSYEESLLNATELERRVEFLRKLDLQCNPDDPCVIVLMHIRTWHKLPLSPSSLLLKYRELLGQVSKAYRNSSLSYYGDKNTFFTIFASSSNDSLEHLLRDLYEKFDSEIGCSLRMYYCATDFSHIKEGLQALQYEETEFGLSHTSDAADFRQISPPITSLESISPLDRYSRHMDAIRNYILEHIDQPITRTQIAEALFLSPSHVSYIIKEMENLSCKELITKIKMDYARKLLRGSKYAIGDIAIRCGYDSFAYFSKVYKQTFSITPSMERNTDNP